jgi:hypothetical protein
MKECNFSSRRSKKSDCSFAHHGAENSLARVRLCQTGNLSNGSVVRAAFQDKMHYDRVPVFESWRRLWWSIGLHTRIQLSTERSVRICSYLTKCDLIWNLHSMSMDSCENWRFSNRAFDNSHFSQSIDMHERSHTESISDRSSNWKGWVNWRKSLKSSPLPAETEIACSGFGVWKFNEWSPGTWSGDFAFNKLNDSEASHCLMVDKYHNELRISLKRIQILIDNETDLAKRHRTAGAGCHPRDTDLHFLKWIFIDPHILAPFPRPGRLHLPLMAGGWGGRLILNRWGRTESRPA